MGRTYDIAHSCEWCGEEAPGHILYQYDGMWMCRECVKMKLAEIIKTLPKKSVYDFDEEYEEAERDAC